MKTRNHAIVFMIAVMTSGIFGCFEGGAFEDVKGGSLMNTLPLTSLLPSGPVLNDLVITATDSSSITLAQPTLLKAVSPAPTVEAYIGIDGTIKVNGKSVTDYLEGTRPVDVSGGGYVFSNLSLNTVYRIIVIAQNSNGYSVKQIVQSTAAIAPVINDLVISTATSTSITLARPTFSVAGNPLPTVNAYIGRDGTISVSGSSVSNYLQGPVDVSGAGRTFNSLSTGVLYRIIVVARNIQGASVKQITAETPSLYEITNLSASHIPGGIKLTWTDPVPGDDVDHIEVTWNPNGSTAQDVAKGVQTYSARSLTDGVTYTFTVKASDRWGNTTVGKTTSTTVHTGWYTFLGSAGDDMSGSIRQTSAVTSDGGYIFAGSAGANIASMQGKTPKNAYSGGEDMLVVKLTPSGSVDWYTFLGGGGLDGASSIQQALDGGFIVVGSASARIDSLQGKTPKNVYSAGYDMVAVKLTSSGNVDWYTFIGGSGDDCAYAVQQTSETFHGFIICGHSTANIASLPTASGTTTPRKAHAGGYDMLVVKIDSNGYVTWYTFMGGTGNDYGAYILQSTDGYLVVGTAGANIPSMLDSEGDATTPRNSYSASDDIFVVKLTTNGWLAWYTFIGGTNYDFAMSAQQTSDGGYILAGESYANIASIKTATGTTTPLSAYSGSTDMVVVKLDSSGYGSWYTFLGSTGSEEARSIRQTSDGGYIVGGMAYSNIPSLQGKTPLNAHSAGSNFDMFIVKLDSSAGVSWYTFFGGSDTNSANFIQQTTDGGYIITGDSAINVPSIYGTTPLNPYSSGYDIWVIKLLSDGTF